MLIVTKLFSLLLCLFAVANISVASSVITEDDLFAELHLVSSVTHLEQRVDETSSCCNYY